MDLTVVGKISHICAGVMTSPNAVCEKNKLFHNGC